MKDKLLVYLLRYRNHNGCVFLQFFLCICEEYFLNIIFHSWSCNCVSQQWYDHYLQWNQSEYPGVKNLRFTPDQVWTPDILLYNRYVTYKYGCVQPVLLVIADWSLCYCPSALMISLMRLLRPMCWSTPVVSVSICLQVRFSRGLYFPSNHLDL